MQASRCQRFFSTTAHRIKSNRVKNNPPDRCRKLASREVVKRTCTRPKSPSDAGTKTVAEIVLCFDNCCEGIEVPCQVRCDRCRQRAPGTVHIGCNDHLLFKIGNLSSVEQDVGRTCPL